jgi:hypothetical protein
VLRRERTRISHEEDVKRSEAALQKLREKEAKKKAGKAPMAEPVILAPTAATPAVETAVPIETFPIEPLLAPIK